MFAALGIVKGALGAEERPHTLTGEFRTHAAFHSRSLEADRDILVYLPPGYDRETKRRYPVLYLHDGQNLFDGATSFIPGKEWHADEAAQSLIAAGKVEPLIMVGIYNAGRLRVDEYTPTRSAQYNAGGKADLYGRMIVEELKPFIDRNYRTKRGAADTGLGGSSLGGLVTLHLGLKYPKTFGKLAVVSPSVWWDDRMIVQRVRELKRKPTQRIWLDMGTDEASDPKRNESFIADARLLRDALMEKGWKPGHDLKYGEVEGAKHSEDAWAAQFPQMLEYLFPAMKQ